ncbi:MAG TPA: AAA family ATPase [Cyclobacteriaceae bacterium]
MIKNLSIRNYKSIKELDINTTRINVFIGEHNSGKSNILEALGWFSINVLDNHNFPKVFRFKTATDFFYDFDLTQPIEIKTDKLNLLIRYAKDKNGALLNELEGIVYSSTSKIDPKMEADFYNLNNQLSKYHAFRLSFKGELNMIFSDLESFFRAYIFKKIKSFDNNFRPFLNPPFGENIPSLLISNKKYKELVGAIFKEKGFRLMLKPDEGDINMAKDVNDELYSYPYTSISETLQRIIFYTLAIESNKDASIIFDEPESNTFPMYTKQLAEQIAFDKSNQYFIVTHDPYLLNSLTSKTPVEDLSVFVTEMKNYQTKVTKVETKDLSTLMDKGADIYFNLNKLISSN